MKASLPLDYQRYRIFHFMWCLFILIHHCLTFSEWTSIGTDFLQASNNFYRIAGICTMVFTILSILKPRIPVLFAACLFSWTVLKFGNLPFVPNHIILALIANGCLLASICYHLTTYSDEMHIQLGRIYASIAPHLKLMLVILYFFTVFHKLNWDYFDPEVSCGAILYQDIVQRLPILPSNIYATWATMIGTLLIECLIPILLLWRGLVLYGMVLGVLFHFLLSLHPNTFILSFSAEIYAFYVLFLPASFIKGVFSKVSDLRKSVFDLSLLQMIAAISVILAILALINGFSFAEGIYEGLKDWLFNLPLYWYIWSALLLFLLVRSATTMRYTASNDALSFSLLSFFPLLLVLNGLTPYFGIKTATNFSMFSNLKIVGKASNHMLIRQNVPLLSHDAELVEITASDGELFNDVMTNREYITLFEFKRRIKHHRSTDSTFVSYLFNDEEMKLNLPLLDSHSPLGPLTFLEEKFLIYRGVPKSDPCHCQW